MQVSMTPARRRLALRLVCGAFAAHVVAVWVPESTLPHAVAEDRLAVGSMAPPIDIEHWFNGKEPIGSLEPDQAYVIEFWATWCGPCVASMPHLRDLQQRHRDDIRVISVSDEDPATIERFLERERDGDSFREITSGYWLASDPDGSMKRDYMKAAEQRGIPTAFLIGKTGLIEWIGHPGLIDGPVAQVLAGTWDREAFVRQREQEQQVREKVQNALAQAKSGRRAEALAAVDALLADTSLGEMRPSVEAARRRMVAEAAAESASDSPVMIRNLAIGDRVTMQVKGRKTGSVWGDSVYTLDSDVGTAAVHAGLVRDGETKLITVWIVPSPTAYGESNRNGVQSRRWGAFKAAFCMQAVAVPAQGMNRQQGQPRQLGIVDRLQPGESATLPVTGSDKGMAWGSGIYTGDSSLDVAAAHSGAVRVGERGEVIVTRVQPPASYEGSVRHGVETRSWKAYPTAFTVMPKPAGAP